MPNQQLVIDVHSCEVNWAPLSNDMSTRIPKCEIQWGMSAWAQLVLVISQRKMASGQREKWSTIVRRWVKPLDDGQGFDSGPVTARNITRKSVLPNFARHVLSKSWVDRFHTNDFSVPEDYLYAHGVIREQRRARTCNFVRDRGTYRVRAI